MNSILRHFRKHAFSAFLILSLSFGFEAYSQSAPSEAMPLGNSVTQGSQPSPTYHYEFRKMLTDTNIESISPEGAASQVQASTEKMRIYPARTKSQNPVTLQMLALQPLEKFNVAIYTLEGKLVKEFEAEADSRGNFTQLINPAELKVDMMYMVQATLEGRAFIRHLFVDR